MNERDLIATQTIKQVSEGGDQVRADLKATAAAQDQLAASSTNLATVTETSARRQTSAAAAFNAMARAMDPAARAFADLERNQATFGRALSQNSSMLDKAGQGLDVYARKLDAARTAAEALRRQQSNLTTDPNAVTGSVRGTPISLNQITGTQTANLGKDYAAQFEAAAHSQDVMAASALKLRTAINPLEAEQGRLAAELKSYKQALDAGKISQGEYAAAQAMAGKRLGDFAQNLRTAGTAGRVMSGEMTNLGFQLNDVVTGLALGQSPFMILAQQGGQITQIFANSKSSIADFASSSIAWFRSLITPVTVTVAAVGALAAAAVAAALQMDRLQVSSQRAISGAGQRTGTTVSDLNKFTEQNSSTFGAGLSTKEARALGEDFTKTGEIVISRLHGMSDAVLGFANQTGQSMDDARKAMVGFAVDPKNALDELSKTYGNFDVATRRAVDALVLADDKTGAFQVIIDSLSKKSKEAAENMGFFEKAGRGIVNFLATETVKPSGPEADLAAAQARAASAQRDMSSAVQQGAPDTVLAALSEYLAKARQEVDKFQGAVDKVNAEKASAEITKLSTSADKLDKAIIPQIAQIEQLQIKLAELERVKAAGATSKYGADVDNAAALNLSLTIAKTQEAQEEAARYDRQVANISLSWGDVGQSTALALQAAENQLPVLQAITGAERMAAQYAADYANAKENGKTAAEATALAASNLRAAEASASAAAQQQTQQIADNNRLQQAGYVSQYSGMRKLSDLEFAKNKESAVYQQKSIASQQAYNQVLKDGGTVTDANNRAYQVGLSYQTQIQSAAEQVKAAQIALNTETAQWRAELLGVGSAAEVVGANYSKILQLQQQIDQATAAYNASAASTPHTFDLAQTRGDLTFQPNLRYPISYKGGGLGKNLDVGGMSQIYKEQLGKLAQSMSDSIAESAKFFANTSTDDLASLALQKSGSIDSTIGSIKGLGSRAIDTVSTLYDLKNSQTIDPTAQASNLQAEISWLQTLPETIARDQKIISLQQSIDQLKNSTDANTAATQATLNPLYPQGHGALAIGYYKAAGGLDVTAQGPTSGDQIPFHAMVNGGENIKITPAGQSTNDNSKTININQYFPGGSTDTSRRSMRQARQGFAQSMAAAAG